MIVLDVTDGFLIRVDDCSDQDLRLGSPSQPAFTFAFHGVFAHCVRLRTEDALDRFSYSISRLFDL